MTETSVSQYRRLLYTPCLGIPKRTPVKPCAQTATHGVPDEICIRDYTHANDLTVAMYGLRNDIIWGRRRRSVS